MTDRAMHPDSHVEALLRTAAAGATWPATPDLRQGVLEAIAVGPGATVLGPRTDAVQAPGRPSRRLSLVRALVLAMLALVALAGVATALGYRLPGLDIVFVDPLPPAGAGLELGSEVPLAEARAGEQPRVLVPGTLPEPVTAFVLGTGDRRIVTLAWRADPGEPALAGTDLSLGIMAVPGRTDEGFLTKLLGPGTSIEPVDVDGDRGWWISGLPHDLLVRRPDGTVSMVTTRLAGDTLVFSRDGTLYRLESALGRDRTLAIARSLR